MMKNLSLQWKIMIGMVLGVIVGLISSQIDGAVSFSQDWINPIGKIFINLLMLIAVPLVIVSLAKGVADLRDFATLSRIGGRSILLFLITTVGAVILGLILVNYFEPGANLNVENLQSISEDYRDIASDKIEIGTIEQEGRPLDFFVDLVPQNIFEAMSQNGKMLQIIFFTLFFSICLLLIPAERRRPITELLDVSNDIVLKMVEVIMWTAPYAVFALMVSLIVETTDGDLFSALMSYALILVAGMMIILIFYVVVIRFFTSIPTLKYINGILPAQLVAFTTSSSMATLPVTMECVEENLGVEKEVSSFVCPVGATLNMDSTSLMQAIATVFVCQVVGHELDFSDQLTIVLTGSLASIGAAGAPSAGIVMLIMVLESVQFPTEHLPFALAMILAVDRPLDMGRAVVNISGDCFVSVLVAESLNKRKNEHSLATA